MYRGKTSKDFYQFVNEFNFLLECQRYTMYVKFIDNNNNSSATGVTKKEIDNKSTTTTVVPVNDHPSAELLPDQLFAQINSSDQEIFARGSSGHIEAHFEADFKDLTAQLSLKIQQKSGYWPMNYFNTIEEFSIPPEKLLAITQFNQPVQADSNGANEDDPSALYYILDKAIEPKSAVQKIVPDAKRYDTSKTIYLNRHNYVIVLSNVLDSYMYLGTILL
jgi:hypothetical protein